MLAAVRPVHEFQSPRSDVDIAKAVAAGDLDGFATLMRRHNRLLYRTARSILKDDHEAEDALQNAYLLAYREMGKFRGDSKLSTWLTRIVINEALACLRKRARSAHVVNLDGAELDDAIESAAEPAVNAPERPDEELMRADTRRLIASRIDELPLAYRTVFVLRAVEELSVTEVAETIGIPEATVRTRFFRARALLRRALASDGELGAAFPFAGVRCDAIVERVLRLISSGTTRPPHA
jgi:RNA polymerase sigma-70 factor (ECF subfamily)